MPIPAGQTCVNCKFMDLYGPYRFYGHDVVDAADGTQLGWCRENSPQPRNFAAQGNYDILRKTRPLGVEWPEVRADDWCARWQGPVTAEQPG